MATLCYYDETTQTWKAISTGGGGGGESGGLTPEVKAALLNCFAHVQWVDEHGQDYYNALVAALGGV